jgi:hypothetical protein
LPVAAAAARPASQSPARPRGPAQSTFALSRSIDLQTGVLLTVSKLPFIPDQKSEVLIHMHACTCMHACIYMQVAVELLKLTEAHGLDAWVNPTLNKKPYSITGVSLDLGLSGEAGTGGCCDGRRRCCNVPLAVLLSPSAPS